MPEVFYLLAGLGTLALLCKVISADPAMSHRRRPRQSIEQIRQEIREHQERHG